jgi:cobalt/nickel transport system permease protein
VSARTLVASLAGFRQLDLLATRASQVHRLDARAKVLVALAFVVSVVSFDRYAIAPLLPFCAVPLIVALWSGVPLGAFARRVLVIVPVAVLIGLPNPFFDRVELAHVGGVAITTGWVSLVSIVLRAVLAAAACIALVAVTGFPAICSALQRLGLPSVLAVQLMFLYRYLTVLGEEALRMARARELRGNDRPVPIREYGALIGRLLLRTWDRAERIYLAMLARGFDGEFRSGMPGRFGAREFAVVVGCSALFLLFRFGDLVQVIGTRLVGAWT